MKPYDRAGFYRDIHYLKVEEVEKTDVCLLNDTFTLRSSLEPVDDVKGTLFFAREIHLDSGCLPDGVVQRCDKLRTSKDTHDNVATFLGLIVEDHVQPFTYSAAKIFEEYAEGELMLQSCVLLYVQQYPVYLSCMNVDTFSDITFAGVQQESKYVSPFDWLALILSLHVSPPFCCHGGTVNMVEFFHYKSEWKAEAKLFCDLWPDDTFRLVVRWSYQLFSALSYLHQRGISHQALYGELTILACLSSTLMVLSCEME